jgi:hypothetical protein
MGDIGACGVILLLAPMLLGGRQVPGEGRVAVVDRRGERLLAVLHFLADTISIFWEMIWTARIAA